MNEIDELIARKIDLARKVLDCSEVLLKMSYSEDPGGFEHFLEKRAQCIEGLIKTDILLKNQLRKAEPGEGEQFKERLEEVERQVKTLLSRVFQLDQQNKKRLLEEMAEIKRKLAFLHKSDQGRKAYINQGQANPYGAFMDSRK